MCDASPFAAAIIAARLQFVHAGGCDPLGMVVCSDGPLGELQRIGDMKVYSSPLMPKNQFYIMEDHEAQRIVRELPSMN
jgi:hypothetical protein